MGTKTVEHTPGPWKVITNADVTYVGSGFRSVVGANGEEVIDIQNDGCASDPSWDYITLSEANARLIAAAPELLAALKAVASHPNGGCSTQTMEIVRAAIRLAEGEL